MWLIAGRAVAPASAPHFAAALAVGCLPGSCRASDFSHAVFLSLQEVKATPSSKVMLGWLKSSQEDSPQKKENDLPRWTSQFIHSPSPKKTSAGVLRQWLGKEGEPAAKKHKA